MDFSFVFILSYANYESQSTNFFLSKFLNHHNKNWIDQILVINLDKKKISQKL
jgi:hypothetical protein